MNTDQPSDLHFSDRLAQGIKEKRSTVCVGIDPRWDSLPKSIKVGVDTTDLRSMAQATGNYCRMVVDAVVDSTPIIKPQAAFFEQLGPQGLIELAGLIEHARQAGLLVLLDGKRGDIGSTAEAYADAYLGATSPWRCDALTISPYLGSDTLQPFLDTAAKRKAGVFVLVKTSNPGSGFLQDLQVDGETIFQRMGRFVQQSSLENMGECGYGHCGAVVGATYPEQLSQLRASMPNCWLLIPGYGAQGGSADDVAAGYDSHGLGAIVNSSRGIIFAYQQPAFADWDWQDAVAQAAREMREQLPKCR